MVEAIDFKVADELKSDLFGGQEVFEVFISPSSPRVV